MAAKKATQAQSGATTPTPATDRKRWVKLTPRDHVLKQIEAQQKLVEMLREQLTKEEQTLQGMEKAKEFFPS